MSDYIKKNDVRHLLLHNDREAALAKLDELESIDAMHVVHGYNTKDDSPSLFGCSVCGWFCWDTYCGDTDTYNYCPNCGAKMKGENDEQIH